MRVIVFTLLFCICLFPLYVESVLDWPGTNSFKLSENLPNKFSASGAVWIAPQNMVATVGDEGNIALVSTEGNITVFLSFTTDDYPILDFEGITTGPDVTNTEEFTLLYVMIEYPAIILEVEIPSGEIHRSFSLDLVEGKRKRGIEALTFVPETESSGYFYAGSQYNGMIYIYHFDYYNSHDSLALFSLYNPIPGRIDISGLCWDMYNEMLWVLYDDGSDVFTYLPRNDLNSTKENHQDWAKQHHYSVPGKHQEGIAIGGTNGEFIMLAEDRNERDQQLKRYDLELSYYPATHDDEDYWYLYYYGDENTEYTEYTEYTE